MKSKREKTDSSFESSGDDLQYHCLRYSVHTCICTYVTVTMAVKYGSVVYVVPYSLPRVFG